MRFGILGTAAIARNSLVPAIQATEHEVFAIASRDADRAQAFADEFGIERSYGSYDDMLADSDLDAVYIPLPNTLHEEWTIRAAEAGLHILCEKPLATDAEGARRMEKYCEDAGVTLMEAYMHQYHPQTRRAITIAREQLGDIHEVVMTFQAPRGGEDSDLVSLDPDAGGGSLMHLGCYLVTMARSFLGEPARVSATALDIRDCGVDTQFAGVLEYDTATIVMTCGFDTERYIDRYRVEAANGWLQAEDAFVPRNEQTALEYTVDGRHVTEEFDVVDPYLQEVEHFASCISSGEQPLTSSGVKNMAIIDALYESVERGRIIDVEA